ncbi:DUF427 domain-containing protein [Microbacterium sp. NE2HP2]|uniref:DUF427 domain-containing protein n=1 Tax=Microbacterium TaxID=33882 RepID=UPI000DCC82A4|nr:MULTISPECIES: DUF427 domain-containing protein [Microbacterium]MCZ4066106.1 DUF427 domain-containing protein [Microbacterium sp. H37-C3]MDD7945989.1 DUF427 domain-containing protein [Microbacterium plantarum]RAZ30235.1 hypothetical protein DO944_15145 [Microbacterium sp. SMR1]WHE34931.1 DUF427 domain-containing protein [Microbacterium sp. BDGP8]WRK16035.1 DUF427 domain-containing protein [Microbacterium plantarum]
MRARLGDTIIAEADESDLVRIEGNWYFPPRSIAPGVLTESDTAYTCAWKGDAQYFDVAGSSDKAWSYPTPYPTAIERVGTDFSGYVAFDRSVVIES